MKKLLVLGGSHFVLPVIKAAHELGCYVITADYLPDNIAHKYSDEYCNVSIIEKDAVLNVAKRMNIDGIISFACDPGVVTAAYVAEKLGLPSCGPYESVCILQNKGRFRQFLTEHKFNVPVAKSYTSVDVALKDIDLYNWPVIVKPTDSAGSKGVTRVDDPKMLEKSIRYALSFSHCKEFIIEDFIVQKGFSSTTDSFSINGKLKFVSFADQRFDIRADNPYVPAAFNWPSSISVKYQEELASEIQRLLTLLNMGTSIYNFDVRVGMDEKAYIMEVTPRGGGNRHSEMLRYATGVDLIKNSVRAALGEPIIDVEQKPYNGYWAEVILHSETEGIFKDLKISNEIEKNVVERDLWIEPGAKVRGFSAANETIGTLVLKFDSQEEMNKVMDSVYDFVEVIVK